MSFDEQPDGDIHGECAQEIHRLTEQVEALAAQNETMRSALYGLIVDCDVSDDCQYGTLGVGHVRRICDEAIFVSRTSAEIMRTMKAKVLRDAAAKFYEYEESLKTGNDATAAQALERMADEIMEGK